MSLPIFLFLIFSASTEAMFKPIYYGGDSEEVTTSEATTATMRWNYVCDSGWHAFNRTPSEYNENTGVWCVKFIPSETAISVNNASALCETENSNLTDFENDAERLEILADAQAHIIDHLKHPSGAIALAGKLIRECTTLDKTVLSNLLKGHPCNDSTKVYTLPSSSGTNPDFLWKNWATGEPSHILWASIIEDCLQMFVTPSNPSKHGKINDFYCVFSAAPNDVGNPDYMNYGALCGKQPDIEASL